MLPALFCFTKDAQPSSIPLSYTDGRESRQIDVERYLASKKLRGIIERLDKDFVIYHTVAEKYFTIEVMDTFQNEPYPYKVCMIFFKENRLLRLHITSAFFDKTGKSIHNKGYSLFKIAMDTKRRKRSKELPKEANNNFKKKNLKK